MRNRLRSDAGDVIVTPAVLLLGVAATLVVGALVFVGARTVAPKVTGARQNTSIDDQGNVVEEGIGVAPVATDTPDPTEEPTEAPVVRTRAPTNPPVFIHPTQTPFQHETDDPFETDDPHDHDTPEPDDTPDPDNHEHDDGSGT